MARILCITAHPDDEAANFGGAVARYTEQGHECRLVCLTAGEAARNRGGAVDNAGLQALRRQELAESCRKIGFAAQEVWDLPDAHLPEAPFHATVGRLVGVVRSFRPRLVLSLGPEGSVTAHPDHAMAGLLATAAFHWAGQERFYPELRLAAHQAERLYYPTAVAQPPNFPRVWLPHADVVLDIGAHLETKIAAFRSHHTQAPLFDRVEVLLRLGGSREMYHLAAGRALPEGGTADDLLAGLG